MREEVSWLLRVAALLSVLGLLVASWTLGDYMIRTGVRGSFEHVGAYFVATLLLWVLAYPIAALGYGRRTCRLCRHPRTRPALCSWAA
jgi:hypothetical protein